MRVLGLDPGKVSGWAVVDYENGRLELAGRGDLNWDGKSMAELYGKLTHLWLRYEPQVLAAEKPFLMRGSDTLGAIRVHTLMALAAEERYAEVAEVFPGTARLVVTGKGRRTDSDVAKFVRAVFGLPQQCRPALGSHQPAAMLTILWYLMEFHDLRLS